MMALKVFVMMLTLEEQLSGHLALQLLRVGMLTRQISGVL
jgi:hypothetical protein